MAIFLISVCAIGILIFILPYLLISANPFPNPSGKWQVGTSDLTWDKPDLSGIIAKVWYPTEIENNTPAPYIDDIDLTLSAITEGMESSMPPLINLLAKLIFNQRYFDRVRTPISRDALPSRIPEGFPVILLSPGVGGINFLNTFYALEFASHGFVVIGINHPGFSAVTMLTDRAYVGLAETSKELLGDIINNFDRLAGQFAIEQAENISAIVDKVICLNSRPDSFLYQIINENRIFAVGHSSGGFASFIACGIDRRVSKGVNLDGAFIDADFTNYESKKLLLIQADRHKLSENNKKIKSLLDRDEVQIEKLSTRASLQKRSLRLSNHLDFTDLPLIINLAFAKAIGLTSEVGGLKFLKETAAVVIDFLT
jgi:Platelet-activating factor acetylhydrolase, isoform II